MTQCQFNRIKFSLYTSRRLPAVSTICAKLIYFTLVTSSRQAFNLDYIRFLLENKIRCWRMQI